MVSDIFSWVMSYVERLENLTPTEYGLTAAIFAAAIVALAIVLWKIIRQLEYYSYRKSQLNGWQANRGKIIWQDVDGPLRLEHLPMIPKATHRHILKLEILMFPFDSSSCPHGETAEKLLAEHSRLARSP